jgi:hypothetical protein
VRLATPAILDQFRIRLFGTYAYWKKGDPRPMQEMAEAMDLGGLVLEEPHWIPYTESLAQMANADGLLVLGVDEEGYVPSKLNSYLLSGKPVLACLRAGSPACQVVKRSEMAELLPFGEETNEDEARASVIRFLEAARARSSVNRAAALEEQLAPAMSRKAADLFERVLGERVARPGRTS